MRPLGDAFIRLITMVISLVVFCTIAAGIAGMESMKKVGRVGGKALIYFEVATSLALILGLVAGAVIQPGAGFNVDPASLDASAVANYAGAAKAQSVTEFILNIIPSSVIGAFASGSILSVIFVSVLFGFALASLGPRVKPLLDMLDGLTLAVFGVVNIVMRAAPIGAFGAMAYTVGRFGLSALGPLAILIGTLWIISALFVVVVLGAISLVAGFNVLTFLKEHQGGDHPDVVAELLRSRTAVVDEETGETRMLEGAGRPGDADRAIPSTPTAVVFIWRLRPSSSPRRRTSR